MVMYDEPSLQDWLLYGDNAPSMISQLPQQTLPNDWTVENTETTAIPSRILDDISQWFEETGQSISSSIDTAQKWAWRLAFIGGAVVVWKIYKEVK